jgi:energy-coupling factor transport system ATP-binding protein
VSEPPAVVLRDVRYVYPGGVVAVDGVSLQIPAGQVVAVAGQNGSGKTTLTKLLNGLLQPSSGSVAVDGIETAGRRTQELARHVGYVFQNPNHQLFARTVAEELAFGPRNLGIDPGEVDRRVADVAATFGLTDRLAEHPYRLGYPIRKLVGIASVVAMRPSILVLDEPTTGQDHRTSDAIRTVLQDVRDTGVTIVCVTHDMELVAALADRLVVMREGRVEADGTPRTVFADTATMVATRLRPPQITRLSMALTALAGRPPALGITELVDAVRASQHGASRTTG